MRTVASTPNAGCSGAGTQFVHVFVTLSSLLACLAPLETKKKKADMPVCPIASLTFFEVLCKTRQQTSPSWSKGSELFVWSPCSSCWNTFADHTSSLLLLLATLFHGGWIGGTRGGGARGSWWGGKSWPLAVRPMAFRRAGANWAGRLLTSWLHPWVVVCLEWLRLRGSVWQSKLWRRWGRRRGEVNRRPGGWEVAPVGGKSCRGSRGPIGDRGEH